MKKRYEVELVRVVEIEYDEKKITKKEAEIFSQCMWKADVEEIIQYIAGMSARDDLIIRKETFIEGLGRARDFGIEAKVVDESVDITPIKGE